MNSDFTNCPNYLFQLSAEGKINPTDGIIYVFLKSIKGFDEEIPSLEYLALNTGTCRQTISKSLLNLQQQGLITIQDNKITFIQQPYRKLVKRS